MTRECMSVSRSLLAGLIFLGVGCGSNGNRSLTAEEGKKSPPPPAADQAKPISVTSPAFAEGAVVPKKYTCEGDDVSPPLKWTGVPEGTKSLAVICDDPDAPGGAWVHWVLFNLPATTTELAEGVAKTAAVKGGAIQGTSDFDRVGYGGPCPPQGHKAHRYLFKVYALDAVLALKSSARKKDVENAMKGHILGQGQLTGTYQRK